MLTMDEARGIAARIWTRSNHKRKIMDPQLCEDIADVLVDEVMKVTLNQSVNNSLKDEVNCLKKDSDTLKASYIKLQEEYKLSAKTLQAAIDKAQLNYANLQSDYESLKLKVKPDEVV